MEQLWCLKNFARALDNKLLNFYLITLRTKEILKWMSLLMNLIGKIKILFWFLMH